jgi:hypothetical protein
VFFTDTLLRVLPKLPIRFRDQSISDLLLKIIMINACKEVLKYHHNRHLNSLLDKNFDEHTCFLKHQSDVHLKINVNLDRDSAACYLLCEEACLILM